ncbi:uncharacterized protein LOC135499461 [Lineus longissimus]|uniref:uncharacterized protein LOC135499461 n=1 Tax=Lineus longissimus TaxID=88925 RepID=UPI00315CA95E
MLCIQKSRTSPYHPEGNGMIERFNETLKNSIAKVTVQHGTDWDLHLVPVQLAYNSSVHETTGLSPFYLNHGREPRLPVDVVYGCPTKDYWSSASRYSKAVFQELQEAFQEAQKTATISQERQKNVYDKWARNHPYQVGDKVWLHTTVSKDRHRKLALPWIGPYIIVKRMQTSAGLPGVTYRIQSEDASKRQWLVVHHNRLKPYAAPKIPRPLTDKNHEDVAEVNPPTVQAPQRMFSPIGAFPNGPVGGEFGGGMGLPVAPDPGPPTEPAVVAVEEQNAPEEGEPGVDMGLPADRPPPILAEDIDENHDAEVADDLPAAQPPDQASEDDPREDLADSNSDQGGEAEFEPPDEDNYHDAADQLPVLDERDEGEPPSNIPAANVPPPQDAGRPEADQMAQEGDMEIEAAPDPTTTRNGRGVRAPVYLHDYVRNVSTLRWTY